MAPTARPSLGRRLRLAVAGAAVATVLTVATVAAAPPTPMGVQAAARPRSLTPGFLLDRGRYITIEVPGATVETGAGGINNRGQIVGSARGGGSPDRGFLRDPRGRYSTFRFRGARSTLAQKINDRGQITGYYSNTTDDPREDPTAFLLDRGRYTQIAVPGAVTTTAVGINNRGQVVGQYQDANRRGARSGTAAPKVPSELRRPCPPMPPQLWRLAKCSRFTTALTSSSATNVAPTENGRPEAMRDPDDPSQLTIEDVAQLAGVSVSSARNYFSRPQLLSAPTHARLKAAVAQTGYVPRGSPAGLGRRQRGRLGFEVPRGEDPAANPVFNQLLLSLLWSARGAGYRLQPFVTGTEPGSRTPDYQHLWEQREVAGFVLADVADDDERLAYLQATRVPFVLVGRLRTERGYCWVDTDNAAGAAMAVAHLAGQGHERIAYLGWPAADPVADRRLQGYRQGLAAAGGLPECVAVQSYGQPAVEQAHQLLGRSPRPTAVVAACDEFAYDTIRAAAALGLAVGGGPGQIAVVGCDDSPLTARTTPTLSSLRQPVERLADRAVDLLTATLANPRFEAHVLEAPQLIIRESSAAT